MRDSWDELVVIGLELLVDKDDVATPEEVVPMIDVDPANDEDSMIDVLPPPDEEELVSSSSTGLGHPDMASTSSPATHILNPTIHMHLIRITTSV